VVEVLMRHKADPYIADNDGVVPIKFAENHKLVLAAFHRYLFPEVPTRICARCSEAAMKFCAKCRVNFYCSTQCQADDWITHKPRCAELHKGHKRLAFDSSDVTYCDTPNIQSTILRNFVNMGPDGLPGYEPQSLVQEKGKLFDENNDKVKTNGNMLIKVQVMLKSFLDPTVGSVPDVDYGGKLMVYNEGKSFRCFMDPHKLDGQELISIIKVKGVAGKGYFWAFMKPGQKHLTVITDPIHRAQPW